MPKSTPNTEFKIHVDSSCITNSTDLMMSPERNTSNQTIIHHDASSEDPPVEVEEKAVHKRQNHKATVEDETPDTESELWPDPTQSEIDRERQIDRIEAQIQAAARAVVRSIEHDEYHGEESILSAQTDESYDHDSELTYGEGTELTYGEETELTYDGTEGTYETEDEHHDEAEAEPEDDSSSHHDGDIDDDVFSNSDRSGRSSLNSCHDPLSSDELKDSKGKVLTSPGVGEEAATEPLSRIPSAASYTPQNESPNTPSRVLSRPPFRTPSSVRAIQMSSPTPSIFASPRSTKRHLPTVSRIGTPHSQFSSPSKKTPTRFKTKKEYPLVLLHVTVLPLSWSYSHVMSSPDLPPTLQSVKDNWRLLQEKLGDTVLERGILLPHPQDSYEVLEERLLEALELPVRPRARILKCGHYMGPETPLSSSEDEGDQYFQGDDSKWCDICGREVRIEGLMDGKGEQRFRIKIYASNGLMRAGAWAAAWREMERVDVEIEPFVEGGLAIELEHMAANTVHPQEDDDGFVDEDEHHIDDSHDHYPEPSPQMVTPNEDRLRRKLMDEERMREIYGPDTPMIPTPMERPRLSTRNSSRSIEVGDSLPELLLAAFKIAMRDSKNVAICVLSVLVLLLALRSGSTVQATPPHLPDVVARSLEPVPERIVSCVAEIPSKVPEVVFSSMKAVPEKVASVVAEIPAKIPEVVQIITSKVPEVIETLTTAPPAIEKVVEEPQIMREAQPVEDIQSMEETEPRSVEEELLQVEERIQEQLPVMKHDTIQEPLAKGPEADVVIEHTENHEKVDEEESIPI